MAFLERFRSQPKWKHRDASVRLAAVEEMSLDEQETLSALASEDEDARVRRAAVAKVTDLAIVARVRDGDTDAGVREEAARLIVDTALGAFEGTTEEESLKALSLINDAREVVEVAKQAASEKVAGAALSRVDEEKLLGSIARRSIHAGVRLEALARVNDPGELAAIALRTDFKDVATAASGRVQDREALEAIAARAKNKSASRAARVALKALEPAQEVVAAAPQQGPQPPPAVPQVDLDVRRSALCETIESLVTATDSEGLRERLERALAAWAALPPPSETAEQRFSAAVARVRARLEELAREDAARSAHEQEVRSALEQRQRIVDGAERIVSELRESLASAAGGSDTAAAEGAVSSALGRFQELSGAWEAMGPLSDPTGEAAAAASRFERAAADLARLQEEWTAARERRQELDRILSEAAAAGSAGDFAEVRRRWSVFRQAWRRTVGEGAVDSDLQSRYEAVEASYREREEKEREERARQEQENLARLTELASHGEKLVSREDLSLKDADRLARNIKAALERPGPFPSKKDREGTIERLKSVQTALAPRLQELREADEWQRWANATIQEELCRKAEALAEEPDPAVAARKLRELQAQWKKVTLVPRDRAQALWLRFKAAQDAVRARTDSYFAAQAEERAQNLAKKEALCERAEALMHSTDWIKTADAIKALQAEWKAIGPVPRGSEKAIWDRFHRACDTFFTRRREDLAQRKQVWAANAAAKQELISRVEALGADGDWARASEELRSIQAEWRKTGPTRKKNAEELWRRFQEACARFRERMAAATASPASPSGREAREAACAILESLLPSPGVPSPSAEASEGYGEAASDQPAETAAASTGGETASADVASRLREAWSAWEQAGPVQADELAELTERFRRAFAEVVRVHAAAVRGTEFDVEKSLQKMEELCRKVEELAGDEPPGLTGGESPAEILAARWREALATNTIAGGSSGAAEEARRRAAADAVREAQAAWKKIGPVPDDLARPLAVRFQKACSKVLGGQRHRRQ